MGIPLRVLIVEHSELSTDRVLCELRLGGYAPVHERVETAAEMRDALARERWDIVVAAYVLPTFGANVARALMRRHGFDLPFVVIGEDTGEDIAAALIRPAAGMDYRTGACKGLLPATLRILRTAAAVRHERQAEERLGHGQMHFRQLMENVAVVFWVSDAARQELLYVSPGYQQLWGRSCESLYAQPSAWLETVHHDDRERVSAAAARIAAGDYEVEYRIVRPDGSQRWVRERVCLVRDAAGLPQRLAGIADDITDRRQARRDANDVSDDVTWRR